MARTYGARNDAPKNPEDLAQVLADPEKAAATFGGDQEAWGRFHRAYAAAAGAADPSIEQQVREQTQRVLGQFLRGNGATGAPVDFTPGAPGALARNRSVLFNKQAPGARLDGRFTDWGHFARETWHGNKSPDQELMRLYNSFGTIEPSSGGFLVPEAMRSEILQLSLETSIVRSRATIIPMPTLRVPVPAIDETTHVGSVRGGLVAYWTEEGAQLTETQAKFAAVALDAKKITCYGEVPNELFQDAVGAFDAWLRVALPDTISFYEDLAFLNGSGVGEPLGVLKGAGLISVTRTAANKIDWLDILAMVARLLPSSFNRAVWVASPATLPELGNLQSKVKNVAGTENVGGSAIWLTDGGVDRPTSILGRPLLISEKVPTLGTAGDLCLVDFSHYLVGDRMAMSFETSAHFKFNRDLTALRAIERLDGRPWVQSAVTPANSGATLSPYVRLN